MPRVIVAGSVNLDIVATVPRQPRAGETLVGSRLSLTPGGKGANQAVSAARLGVSCVLVGKLGKDPFADDLANFLAEQGIDLQYLKRSDRSFSGVALILLVNAENTIVYVPGANGELAPEDLSELIVDRGDILVTQLEIPDAVIRKFLEQGRAVGATTLLNLAPARDLLENVRRLADIIVLNEIELRTLAQELPFDPSPEQIASACHGLHSGDQVYITTLGRRGVVGVTASDTYHLPARDVTAIDTTGAGDCFVGALAAALAQSYLLRASIEFANAAAALCVQKQGAGPSMPFLSDVIDILDKVDQQ